jgi:hypothetical protein
MLLTFHVKQRGRLCIITGDDGRLRREVPRAMLRRQMQSYGVTDDNYNQLCQQLDAHGEAIVEGTETGGRFSEE